MGGGRALWAAVQHFQLAKHQLSGWRWNGLSDPSISRHNM